jgi:hypothetical protein
MTLDEFRLLPEIQDIVNNYWYGNDKAKTELSDRLTTSGAFTLEGLKTQYDFILKQNREFGSLHVGFVRMKDGERVSVQIKMFGIKNQNYQ